MRSAFPSLGGGNSRNQNQSQSVNTTGNKNSFGSQLAQISARKKLIRDEVLRKERAKNMAYAKNPFAMVTKKGNPFGKKK